MTVSLDAGCGSPGAVSAAAYNPSLVDVASRTAAEPQEETLMKGAQKPKKDGKKPAQKTLKEKRQDKRNAAKGNSSIT